MNLCDCWKAFIVGSCITYRMTAYSSLLYMWIPAGIIFINGSIV